MTDPAVQLLHVDARLSDLRAMAMLEREQLGSRVPGKRHMTPAMRLCEAVEVWRRTLARADRWEMRWR